MKNKNTHKAILEVEFNEAEMVDKETLKADYNNDLLRVMQELYDFDGFGVFNEDIKLVRIEKLK